MAVQGGLACPMVRAAAAALQEMAGRREGARRGPRAIRFIRYLGGRFCWSSYLDSPTAGRGFVDRNTSGTGGLVVRGLVRGLQVRPKAGSGHPRF